MGPVMSHFFVTDHSLWAIHKNFKWPEKPPWVLVWQGLDGEDVDQREYFADPEIAAKAIANQKTGVDEWDSLPPEEVPDGIADLGYWQHIPGDI